jgi:hypothetical protein
MEEARTAMAEAIPINGMLTFLLILVIPMCYASATGL